MRDILFSRPNTLDENKLYEILPKLLTPCVSDLLRSQNFPSILENFYFESQCRKNEIDLRLQKEWCEEWVSYFDGQKEELNYILDGCDLEIIHAEENNLI